MKINRIQFRVFIFYGAIAAMCVLLCAIFLTSEAYSRLSSQAKATIMSDATQYSDSIDHEIQAMYNSAFACLFDTKVQDFLSYHSLSEIEGKKVSEVASTLTSSILFADMVHQSLLHLYCGKSVTSRSSALISTDVTAMDWYDEVYAAQGRMILTRPYLCSDPTMSTDTSTTRYLLSLCCLTNDAYRVNKGVLEVRQYASKVFAALGKNKNYDIAVLDKNGTVIYPYNVNPTTLPATLTTLPEGGEAAVAYLQDTSSDLLVANYRSAQTGYTVVVQTSTSALLFQTKEYVFTVALVATTVFLLLLLFSYYAALSLTQPMDRLKTRMERSADISVPLAPATIPSGIHELDALEDAFVSMRNQLDESVHKQLLAQQQELQYKFLAIQSQMNPHFLHNSLANISAMADEGQVDQIGYMCKRLSNMLRYIASNREGQATLRSELDFARSYSDALKVRFADNLQCIYQVDESILDLPIPKLTLQPLLENSVKHCREASPPYHVTVQVQAHEEGFAITVTDNGPGFTPEALHRFAQKIEEIQTGNALPTIELNGMGLVNIYLRLHLLYGEHAIFEIENLPTGASVHIGARKAAKHAT